MVSTFLYRFLSESLAVLTHIMPTGYGYDLGIYWQFKDASNSSGLTASILSKTSTEKHWDTAGLQQFS